MQLYHRTIIGLIRDVHMKHNAGDVYKREDSIPLFEGGINIEVSLH